jgi:hypothetical protein
MDVLNFHQERSRYFGHPNILGDPFLCEYCPTYSKVRTKVSECGFELFEHEDSEVLGWTICRVLVTLAARLRDTNQKLAGLFAISQGF